MKNPTALKAETDHSNIVSFDQAARAKQIREEREVKAALDKFSELIKKHGCRWVWLHAAAPDGTRFHVNSHDSTATPPGLDFYVDQPNEKGSAP